MNDMITAAEKEKLASLIGCYRTAAVRRFAVKNNLGGPGETAWGVQRKYRRAFAELCEFVDQLMEQPK